MKISNTPHLDYAQECYANAQKMHRDDWRDNWLTAMWKHLFWAVEAREIASGVTACGGGSDDGAEPAARSGKKRKDAQSR